MNYEEMITADIRLAMLQVLEQDADYSHNEHILQALLGKLGHSLSGDRVRTELRWLHEQGLVDLDSVGATLVAHLRPRGQDVAMGRARIDGVARPRPRG